LGVTTGSKLASGGGGSGDGDVAGVARREHSFEPVLVPVLVVMMT
jgi:hypothetical protein